MTKANDLASLLDANGDVVSSALDNVPSADLVNDTTPQLGGTLDTNGNDITFADNDKAIFGAGSDLQIYHDGINSYIHDAGAGGLYFRASSVAFNNAANNETISYAQEDGAVTLYHDGSPKIATTATGVDAINTAGSSTSRFGSTYNTGANDGTLVIGNGGSGKAMLRFDYEGTNTDRARIGVSSSAQQLEFYTAGDNKRATLDASGNLLVGQSATALPGLGNTTAGISLAGQYDIIAASRASGAAVLVNRNTDDGSLIEFSRNGSTVGQIRSIAGPQIAIGGTTDGLAFYSGGNQIYPCNMSTGGNRDATIDLGYASSRFKDLYLSGGVKFDGVTKLQNNAYIIGGNAAAGIRFNNSNDTLNNVIMNDDGTTWFRSGIYLGSGASNPSSPNHLDDYEEGTWTPASSTNSTVNSVSQATYTKVGNQVFVQSYLNVTTSSPNFAIAGLPFTSASEYYPAWLYYSNTNPTYSFSNNTYTQANQAYINFNVAGSLTNSQLMISAIYRV